MKSNSAPLCKKHQPRNDRRVDGDKTREDKVIICSFSPLLLFYNKSASSILCKETDVILVVLEENLLGNSQFANPISILSSRCSIFCPIIFISFHTRGYDHITGSIKQPGNACDAVHLFTSNTDILGIHRIKIRYYEYFLSFLRGQIQLQLQSSQAANRHLSNLRRRWTRWWYILGLRRLHHHMHMSAHSLWLSLEPQVPQLPSLPPKRYQRAWI